MAVKQILAFVLGRVGLKLETQSESAVVTGFYPDFTIHPMTKATWLFCAYSPLFRIRYFSKG